MTDVVGNVLLVLLFVLVGVFAATEMALVSLREGQLRNLERRGGRAARTAALARNPNRFLSAVQIGVTVVGFLSAAYGASTIAPTVQMPLVAWGIPHGFAAGIAFVGTTLVIAYLSLILGELAPKRIALQRATGVALLTAPVLDRFASLMRPVIWLLSASTDLVVRTVGGDPGARKEAISHDELRDLVVGHAALGEGERRILMEVFDAGQRSLLEVMRPRTEGDRAMGLAAASAPWTWSPAGAVPGTGSVLGALTRFTLGDQIADWLGIPPEPVWGTLLAFSWGPFIAVREGILGAGMPQDVYWTLDEFLRQFVLLYMSELQMPINITIPVMNNPHYR